MQGFDLYGHSRHKIEPRFSSPRNPAMAFRDVPVIFNQRLLRKRLQRCVSGTGGDNFLMQRVAEDIAARVSLIKRQFPLGVVFGDHCGTMAAALEGMANLDRLIYINTVAPVNLLSPRLQIIGTEEHLPLANECINLAISPLTLQFLNDLPGALIQLKRALQPDGLFIAAFLGGDSLMELRDSLLCAEIDIRGGASPRVHARVDIRDLGALLQRAGFALPVVDSDKITVTYRSAKHLMHDLRDLGLTNVLSQGAGTSLNRATVKRLEEIYQDRYGTADNRIRASFEIIYMTGWTPHESQQKPLKPGSAKQRLADALNTREISISDRLND